MSKTPLGGCPMCAAPLGGCGCPCGGTPPACTINGVTFVPAATLFARVNNITVPMGLEGSCYCFINGLQNIAAMPVALRWETGVNPMGNPTGFWSGVTPGQNACNPNGFGSEFSRAWRYRFDVTPLCPLFYLNVALEVLDGPYPGWWTVNEWVDYQGVITSFPPLGLHFDGGGPGGHVPGEGVIHPGGSNAWAAQSTYCGSTGFGSVTADVDITE